MTASSSIVIVFVVSVPVVPGVGWWRVIPFPWPTLAINDAIVPVELS
jgi:hypothetical protein